MQCVCVCIANTARSQNGIDFLVIVRRYSYDKISHRSGCFPTRSDESRHVSMLHIIIIWFTCTHRSPMQSAYNNITTITVPTILTIIIYKIYTTRWDLSWQTFTRRSLCKTTTVQYNATVRLRICVHHIITIQTLIRTYLLWYNNIIIIVSDLWCRMWTPWTVSRWFDLNRLLPERRMPPLHRSKCTRIQ